MLGTGTAILAVLLVALISSFSTRVQMSRIIAQDERQRGLATMDTVRRWHDEHKSWQNVDQLFATTAIASHQKLLLLNGANQCVASFPVNLCKMQIAVGPNGTLNISNFDGQHSKVMEIAGVPEAVIMDGPENEHTWKLFVLTSDTELLGGPLRFFASMSRSLWIGGGIAALVGFCLSLILAKTLLKPVRDLATAVQCMERGDFSRRVISQRQDELGSLAAAFNSMAAELERQEKLREELFHDVAHELRTPLTNIRCQLESLQDGLALATPATLESIHEEMMLLSRLVDDLRDIALAEAGQLSLDIADCDSAIEIRRVVRVASPVANAQAVQINMELADGLRMRADPGRFAQIMSNLLANAIRHARHIVTIRARTEGSFVIVEVEDDGSGIRTEHLPFIFDRFYRVDADRSRKSGGAGLGLAIVKQLTELQTGSVSVKSLTGHGCRFTLSFPSWL
jgi:signal transduction histidine kinase